MCYAKPGPRCATHALAAVIKKQGRYVDSSPDGVERMMDFLQTRGALEALALKIQALPPTEKDRRRDLVETYKAAYDGYARKMKAVGKVPQTIADAPNDAELAKAALPEDVHKLCAMARSLYAYPSSPMYEKAQQILGRVPKTWEQINAEIAAVVPRGEDTPELADYYAGTERKHFTPGQPGSQFIAAKSIESVLRFAYLQRGGLDGDDREALIAKGCDPRGFAENYRYLMVRVLGRLGVASSKDYEDDVVLTMRKKSPTASAVPTLSGGVKPRTNFATVVLLDNPDDEIMPGAQGRETVLITMFPGGPMSRFTPPSGSSGSSTVEDGDTITVGELRARIGEEFSINLID